MPGSYLLDTNIVIALLANESPVIDAIEHADSILIPCVVAGELWYGAHRSARPEANLAQIDRFLADRAIAPCTGETARRYGRIKNDLRAAGTPIPENDIWIAAIADELGLTIATRDRHLGLVPRITVVSW